MEAPCFHGWEQLHQQQSSRFNSYLSGLTRWSGNPQLRQIVLVRVGLWIYIRNSQLSSHYCSLIFSVHTTADTTVLLETRDVQQPTCETLPSRSPLSFCSPQRPLLRQISPRTILAYVSIIFNVHHAKPTLHRVLGLAFVPRRRTRATKAPSYREAASTMTSWTSFLLPTSTPRTTLSCPT